MLLAAPALGRSCIVEGTGLVASESNWESVTAERPLSFKPHEINSHKTLGIFKSKRKMWTLSVPMNSIPRLSKVAREP